MVSHAPISVRVRVLNDRASGMKDAEGRTLEFSNANGTEPTLGRGRADNARHVKRCRSPQRRGLKWLNNVAGNI
jgi:hypothetical protein